MRRFQLRRLERKEVPGEALVTPSPAARHLTEPLSQLLADASLTVICPKDNHRLTILLLLSYLTLLIDAVKTASKAA